MEIEDLKNEKSVNWSMMERGGRAMQKNVPEEETTCTKGWGTMEDTQLVQENERGGQWG